jgi:hypothetical protein
VHYVEIRKTKRPRDLLELKHVKFEGTMLSTGPQWDFKLAGSGGEEGLKGEEEEKLERRTPRPRHPISGLQNSLCAINLSRISRNGAPRSPRGESGPGVSPNHGLEVSELRLKGIYSRAYLYICYTRARDPDIHLAAS